jgi:hypothetical protein
VSKNRRLVPGAVGDPCPRCHGPTQVYEHIAVTPKLLAAQCYYERWWRCPDPRCQTTLIMPEQYRRWRSERILSVSADTTKTTTKVSVQIRRRPAYRFDPSADPFLGLDPYDPRSQHAGVDTRSPPWRRTAV